MPQELKLAFFQKTNSNSSLGLGVLSSSLGLGFWVVFSISVIFVFHVGLSLLYVVVSF
jgi:hypothetical protein